MKKKKSLKLFLLLLVLALIAAAFVIVNNYFSAKSFANRLFSLRADMKLEEYYDNFDFSNAVKNVFNSKESYLEMAEEKGFDKIDSFKIEKEDENVFSITYGDTTEKIALVKQEEKALFFFDTYKIDVASVSEPIMYISTHIGAELRVEGELIDAAAYITAPADGVDYYDDSFDNYRFTCVFDKEYDITISTDYSELYTAVVFPSEIPHVFREMKLSEESEESIKELSENFVQKFYYALQNGEDFSSISEYITKDPERRSEFERKYNDLYFLFTRGEQTYGLIDICFLESSATVFYPDVYNIEQNIYPTYTTLRYSYNYLVYDGYLDIYEKHLDLFDETTFQLYCVKEDGKWVVSYTYEDLLLNFSY